jgi:hypothetical protein
MNSLRLPVLRRRMGAPNLTPGMGEEMPAVARAGEGSHAPSKIGNPDALRIIPGSLGTDGIAAVGGAGGRRPRFLVSRLESA